MTYSVELVQRGVSSQTLAVAGKSGKLYGNAVASPRHGGVVFAMSLADYLKDAHDIVGNTIASQQWVPEFVQQLNGANARPVCDRCPKVSVAMWDRYYYCAEHAPSNAQWYDESQRPAPAPPIAQPVTSPDVRPPVVEEVTSKVTDPLEKELPIEVMAPPIMGTEKEGQEADADFIPAQMRAPKPEAQFSDPGAAPAPVEAPPPAAERPAPELTLRPPGTEIPKVSALEAITKAVVETLMPQLKEAISTQVAGLRDELRPKDKPQPAETARRGPGKKPTKFQSLRTKASRMGINTFQMSAADIEAAIAAKASP